MEVDIRGFYDVSGAEIGEATACARDTRPRIDGWLLL